MKQLLSTLMVAFLALAFMVEDAEARRLGGARSLGAQRSSRAEQERAANAAVASGACRGRGQYGSGTQARGQPLARPDPGLAAGLGLGWLIGQGGFGGMLGTLLIMALLVGFALVFVLRLFTRPKGEGNLQYAGMGNASCRAARTRVRLEPGTRLRRTVAAEYPRGIRHRWFPAPGQAQFRQTAGGA